jgi:hypothetical protein
MASNLLFYYFGDDEAYFKALQGEFRHRTRLNITFTRIFEKEEAKIQSLFLKVFEKKPAVVFIDFSKQMQDYLHLARLLIRTTLEHELLTVGLVDYLSSPDVLSDSMATGVKLTYIKGPETFDTVYDVTKFIAPQEISAHGFATAKLSETWEAGIPAKVGFIHKDGIHIEADHKASKGDRLRVKHFWLDKKLVPSKEVFVSNFSQSNLFYHFKYNYELNFLFMDEFIPPEGMEEETIAHKKQEREDLITYHKKQLKKWVEDNLSNSFEKRAKVLVIDREFKFYQDQKRTDKFPYTIRCIPYLTDVAEELERLRPQVISFALESEEAQDPKNTNEQLVKLAQVIKAKFEDYNPFIVVFNCKVDSQYLQSGMEYQHVMATSQEFSLPILLRMAEIFEKKMGSLVGGAMFDDRDKVYLKKTSPSSICEILIPIKVIKLSETDMVFESETPIPDGMNLHLTQPVNMYINVQPSKGQGKVPEYIGLIHCLGEEDKKDLRRFVNSIFFREHDAKVLAETEEFKKLNNTKLEEKLAKEKKEQGDQEEELETEES